MNPICKDCCSNNAVPSLVKPAFAKKLDAFVEKHLFVVEIVCRVGLAIFAAILNLKLFVLSAGVGFAVGVVYTVYKNIIREPIKIGLARPTCAQGFFDYLSGTRCPALLSTIITAVFIAGHMHHSPFYVAFCGVPLGAWIGAKTTQVVCNLIYRDIYHISHPIKRVSDILTPIPGIQEAR